jgi:hypothetical protein
MKVVVQSGHVARTTGSTGTNGEQAFNLAVSKLLVRELRARHLNARRIDADPGIGDYRGDVFVAIHADGSLDHSAQGASVGYRNGRGKTLARNIKRAYQRHAGLVGYEIKFRSDNYTEDLHFYYGTGNAVSQNPDCRALIIEGGFLTNHDERTFLKSVEGQGALATAIADGITGDAPPAGPTVNLDQLILAFVNRSNDPLNDTEQVQTALNREYRLHLRTDGQIDEATVAAYKAHQEELYGVGPQADGIPGRESLEALGFRVA